MDETLHQLDSFLRARPTARWLAQNRAKLGPLRTACRCGLNPLLDYFAAGEAALQAKFPGGIKLNDDQRHALDRAWHWLAQREIESLCGTCRRVCAPPLSFSIPARDASVA